MASRSRAAAAALAIVLTASAGAPAGADDARRGAGPGGPGLVVVAPRAFHAALAAYVAHKAKERPTALVALEDVLVGSQGGPGGAGGASGADDPERLKRFLYERHRSGGVGYALLVGDVDVMPVRYMVLDRVTPAAFDWAFYPSDLYYADLEKADGSFEDWNARKEGFHAGYVGEVHGEKNKKDAINYDGIDYLPDVAVGRWPASTPEEVATVAAKTVRYEEALARGDKPGARRAAFLATGGWVDARGLLDGLAKALPAGWTAERRFYRDANPAWATPPPSAAEAVALIEGGVGVVLHAGHGWENGWADSLSWEQAKSLKDGDRLPVVMSAGCSTAYFATLPPYEGYTDVDGKEHRGTNAGEVFTAPPPPPSPYQRGAHDGTGLGERMLVATAGGAAGYIGCDTGSQPAALSLLEGFAKALSASKRPLLGDLWNAAIRHYHAKEHLATLVATDDWYPPSIFFQGMKFMVFGDPTLPLATPAGG